MIKKSLLKDLKYKRKIRSKRNIVATDDRPKLSLWRGNRNLYAQVIDATGKTVLGLSTLSKKIELNRKGFNVEYSKAFGKIVGDKMKSAKIDKVVFDKGPYKYHGKVKAFVEGVREAGINV